MARHRLPKKKGPACTVCKHEHRALIEATRIAGASLDTISAKYGVSRDAVHRHMANHVDDDVRAEYLAAVPLKELAAKAAAEGLSVLEYLSLIRSTLVRQMQLASSVNDRNGVATVARTLNETLRQIGAITGEMGALAARNINITNNVAVLHEHPEFVRLRSGLMRALAPFPDARAAAVEALRSLDAEASRAVSAASENGHQKLIELEAAHVSG
jgi:hypothetical protein